MPVPAIVLIRPQGPSHAAPVCVEDGVRGKVTMGESSRSQGYVPRAMARLATEVRLEDVPAVPVSVKEYRRVRSPESAPLHRSRVPEATDSTSGDPNSAGVAATTAVSGAGTVSTTLTSVHPRRLANTSV